MLDAVVISFVNSLWFVEIIDNIILNFIGISFRILLIIILQDNFSCFACFAPSI